jgi:hypothetical protein
MATLDVVTHLGTGAAVNRVFPQPLPGIDEERLIRVRQCAGCALRYAVFGEHRY